MTREEMKKLLESPIAKAWADGEEVQFRIEVDKWLQEYYMDPVKLVTCPEMFRLKPKPREFWLARQRTDNQWVVLNTQSYSHLHEVIHVREVLE